jgi:hypothetical protein
MRYSTTPFTPGVNVEFPTVENVCILYVPAVVIMPPVDVSSLFVL